jgi:hypothetical protein
LVPPRHEDWQAGEIVDFNRIQGGLKALHAKLSLQHDEDFRKDESVFSLETCLDILQETFPRSPGFWMSNFQPYLAEWPPTLVAILRARWPLPQVDSDDQQTSPEVREKTTRLLEKTFADWVAVDSGMEVLRAAAHAVVADYENRQLEDSLHSITEAFKKFTLAHDAAVDAATAQLSHNFLHEMDMLRSWQDRMAQAHSALQRLDEIRRQQGEIEPLIQWTRKVG